MSGSSVGGPPGPVGFGWDRAAAAGLTFRHAGDPDLAFLSEVYASTRTEELAPVPWSEAEKSAFLAMQFQAQHVHYRQHYTTAQFLVILRRAEPIGRLYLDRWKHEHRVVDIALLPEHRGEGLGTTIMRDLLDEAAAAGKALSIHVEKFNPAQRLYERLGFVRVGETGAYDLMRWGAPAPQP
jgi:ribosomal protein S18 acetylase RimI-like enzyme